MLTGLTSHIHGEAYFFHVVIIQSVNTFGDRIILGWKAHIRKVAAALQCKPWLQVINQARKASVLNEGEGLVVKCHHFHD